MWLPASEDEIVRAVNAPGGLVETDSFDASYDPYGQSTYQGTNTVSNPWQFAGGYLDSTGLYKFGARYYDAAIGRWTQQDPRSGSIADPSSVDRYVYADADPINRVDPTGRDSCTEAVLGTLAAFVGLGIVLVAPPSAVLLAMGGFVAAGLGITFSAGSLQACGSDSSRTAAGQSFMYGQ